MKIVITGGGTGGHVYPGIAVAEALTGAQPGVEILFVGGQHGLETKVVPAAGYAFVSIPVRGLLGKRLLSIPMILWTALRGLFSAYRLLTVFDPDVVFATGGYVSGPVALAACLRRTPVVLQEQNSVPGLTNRLLSRFAQEVHLGLPLARRHFPRRGHLRLSGNPIRRTILAGDQARARSEYGLARDKQTILILGGSQGARSINRAAVGMIRAMRDSDHLQFILQTGPRDYRWALRRLRGLKNLVAVRPFIERMGDAYDLADLVVARSGALTIAEITACGKPAVLVPYPHAAHNHQEMNAQALVDAGAAVMVPDRELRGEQLATLIAKLIDTPSKLREMSNGALTLARPEAAAFIAAALVQISSVEEPTATAPQPEARRRRPDPRQGTKRSAQRPRMRRSAAGRKRST